MSTDWPLTGRETELRRAVDALRGAGGVLLAGPAGVGKSRLAREVLADAGRRGRTGRWIGATEAARAVPLGAFAALIADTDGPASVSLLARVATALRDEVAVLVVDDAHLLDDVSAALLHTLAVERSLGLVVTVRAGEPTPDAVTALWKDELLERLEVTALGESDTATLLHAVLGSPLDAASRRQLYFVTRGNVLWLRHLVRGELIAGRLAEQDGQWRWSGEPEITPALADLIDASIGRLSAAQRLVLELLAFGEPLGTDLLESLADSVSVAELAQRRLVVVEMSRRRVELRLAHPLYGEAVRSRTSALRARQLRGRLAEALASTGRRAGDTLRQAVLALDGDCPADPALLSAAATMAASMADWPLTERLLRAACDGGGGFQPRLALGLSLAGVLRVDEAELELDEAARIAEDDEQRMRAACGRAITRFFQRARPDEAWTLLDEAERVLEVGRVQVEYLRGVRAAFAAAGNRFKEAVELGAPILDAPDASPFAQAWAGYAVVVGDSLAGRADRIEELAERLIAAVDPSSEMAMLRFNLRYLQVFGLGLAGRLDRATACVVWLRDLPGAYAAMARDATGGRIALDRGQVRTAARLFQGNRAFYPGSGGGWTPVFETAIALALGMAGDVAGAREALGRAEESRHPGVRFHEPELALAHAWVSAAEGTVGQATEQAEHAAGLAQTSGQYAVEVLARHSCVCFGDTSQADRLATLAELVTGPRAPAAAAHATALAAGDPDALLAVSAQLEQYDLLLPAADAAAQAAARYRVQGTPAQVTFAVARAGGLAERCDGARTPALLAGMAPLPISDREREVATLARTGLSNRQIAERLHVSVRTVEGHIYRACTRLGLTDRTALAALISDSSSTPPRS